MFEHTSNKNAMRMEVCLTADLTVKRNRIPSLAYIILRISTSSS